MKKQDPSKSECARNAIKQKVAREASRSKILTLSQELQWLGALGVMSWGEAARVEAGTNLRCWETRREA